VGIEGPPATRDERIAEIGTDQCRLRANIVLGAVEVVATTKKIIGRGAGVPAPAGSD
jgi:hypothetical protein